MNQSCNNYQKYHQIFAIVVQTIVASKPANFTSCDIRFLLTIIIGIIVIRTYAIYECSRKIGLLLTAATIAIVGVGVVNLSHPHIPWKQFICVSVVHVGKFRESGPAF